MIKEKLIIIAGMPRAGTSYMYQMLSKHPSIFLPIIKETNYFIYNKSRGIKWFYDLYENSNKDQVMFDISPFYFLDHDFFKNVKEFNSDQKIILFLREPNEWVKSLYMQLKKQTFNMPDYDAFTNGYEMEFEKYKIFLDFKNFDYIKKVEEFKTHFKENLMLVDFTYFKSNKLEVMQEIEKFVGINNYFSSDNIINKKINAGSVKNNKFIAYLSTIEIFRSIAFEIMPEKIIHYIRNKYILGEAVKDEMILPDMYDSNDIFKKYYFLDSGIYKC